MKRMNRRQFTKDLAFLSGITVTLTACGGGGGGDSYSNPAGSTSPPPPTTASADKVAQISDNHGHTARITAAQVAADEAVQVNIEGQAGHPHMVTLPAGAMRDLRAGRTVSTNSTTTDGHLHTVVFSGESQEPPSYY